MAASLPDLIAVAIGIWGLVLCFLGYQLHRFTIMAQGFVAGAGIAGVLSYALTGGSLPIVVLASVLFGVVGAYVRRAQYIINLFFQGAAVTAGLSACAGFLLEAPVGTLVVMSLCLGVVGGIVVIALERLVVTAMTAAVGGLLATGSAVWLFGGLRAIVLQRSPEIWGGELKGLVQDLARWDPAVLPLALTWVLLGGIGFIVQRKPKSGSSPAQPRPASPATAKAEAPALSPPAPSEPSLATAKVEASAPSVATVAPSGALRGHVLVRALVWILPVGAIGATIAWSLAGDGSNERGVQCVPGEQVSCACPTGEEGFQICARDGRRFGACQCQRDDEDVHDPVTPPSGANPAELAEQKILGNRRLTSADLDHCASSGTPCCRLLRNTIYAKHGRRFSDRRLRTYFASRRWYLTSDDYDASMLTSADRANLNTILARCPLARKEAITSCTQRVGHACNGDRCGPPYRCESDGVIRKIKEVGLCGSNTPGCADCGWRALPCGVYTWRVGECHCVD